MSAASDQGPLMQGVFMVAEFILRQDVTKRGPSGDFTRTQVKLLVDSQYPRTVEYPSDKVPPMVAAASRGDVVTLAVFPRVYRDKVYWQGVTGDGQAA